MARLAESQWGVVGVAQLRELGLSSAAIEHWLTRGRLRRLHRGVYAFGHAALRVEGRWMAALIAAGPDAALSHHSAAAHWGFRRGSPAAIHVSSARSRGHHEGVRVHRPRSLAAHDLTVHDRIPVTSVARTLLDLATSISVGDLESALADAQRARLVDMVAIDDVLSRGNGHHGRGKLARVIGREAQVTRSRMERLFLELIREAGLPEPEMNVPFTLGGGEAWRLDVLWRAQMVTVELDSWGFHGDRRSFEQDRERAARLTAAGYRHFQFTWRHLTEQPDWVIETLRSALHPWVGRLTRHSG